MPQLDKERAEQVDQTESTGNGLIENGQYVMELMSVEDTKNGEPLVSEKGPFWVWTWVFPDEEGVRYRKWRQWDRTWLHVDWQMNRPFEALGTTSATNTDELIGKRALVTIDKRIRQDNGETVNYIKAIAALDGSEGETAPKGKGGAKPKADLF